MDSILQSGKGGLIRETKLPMQEFELKMQGGLMREGGRNRGILRYYHRTQIVYVPHLLPLSFSLSYSSFGGEAGCFGGGGGSFPPAHPPSPPPLPPHRKNPAVALQVSNHENSFCGLSLRLSTNISALKIIHHTIPYSGKFSWEKTFTDW